MGTICGESERASPQLIVVVAVVGGGGGATPPFAKLWAKVG